MRILCCLDGTNIEQLHTGVSSLLSGNALTVSLLYVTDSRPRGEIERQRERHLRSRMLQIPRYVQMQQAEQEAAESILDEGTRYFPGAELIRREGHPEREIVQCADEKQIDVIVLCPRSPRSDGPALGPKSVGHVARFVLDHAPCPVLLVRAKVPLVLPPLRK